MTNQKELCLLLRYTTPITKGSIQVPFVTIFYKVWEEEMREGEMHLSKITEDTYPYNSLTRASAAIGGNAKAIAFSGSIFLYRAVFMGSKEVVVVAYLDQP